MGAEPEPAAAWVTVWFLRDAVEGAIAEGALRAAEIPSLVESYHDTAYDGLFTFQKGWGRVKAPREQAEAAFTVLQEALAKRSPLEGE